MNYTLLVALAIAPLLMTAPARADPEYALNVEWEARPSGMSFANNYPTEALVQGVNGSATLDCLIKPDRQLDCVALADEPTGMGFGAAAVAVAGEFRAAPLSKDGVSVVGKRVRIPIKFQLEDGPGGPPVEGARRESTSVTLPFGADLYWESGMITRFYPRAAREAGIEGRVALDCVVNERLRYDCTVKREDPAGHGFAEAALKIMREFYLRLDPGDTSPVGRRSTENIHFRKER